MLYKFHRINNFLYQLLIDSSLWFSKPCDFNDPFDVQFQLNLTSTPEQKEEAIKTLIGQVKPTYSKVDDKVVPDIMKKRVDQIFASVGCVTNQR